MKSIRIMTVLFLAMTVNLNAASIGHHKTKANSGRLVFDFGASAQFKVNRKGTVLQVKVDPQSTLQAMPQVLDHLPLSGCTPQFNPADSMFTLSCKRRKFTSSKSFTVNQPRRFVVEYRTKAFVPTKKAQKKKKAKKVARKAAKSSETSLGAEIGVIELGLPDDEGEPTTEIVSRKKKKKNIDTRYQGRELTLNERLLLRNKVFMRFKPLREMIQLDFKVPEFPINHKEGKIYDLYNLVLRLYRSKKYGLALRTLNTLRQSNSTHGVWKELSFLEAETYVRLADAVDGPKYFQEAIARYRAAMGKYPKSPYVEHAISHVGLMQLKRGDYFGAIDTFIAGRSMYPESKNNMQWKLGIGEALLRQNRFDQARTIYRELARQEENATVKLDGLFRLGDTYIKALDYSNAVKAYHHAIDYENGDVEGVFKQMLKEREEITIPLTMQRFPSVLFNLGESYFWTGDYRNSLWCFREFLSRYPLHDDRALALTRVGEILEIFDGPREEKEGAFLEAHFKDPEGVGSDMAKLRTLSKDLVSTDSYTRRRAELEYKHLTKKYIKNDDMTDFIVLLRAEAMFKEKKYIAGFEYLEKEYGAKPRRPYRKVFKRKIFEYLSYGFRELRRQGRCSDIFKIYTTKKVAWFTKDNLYFDYFLEAGICALKVDLPRLALEYFEMYENSREKIKANPELWKEQQIIQTIAYPGEFTMYRGIANLQLGRLNESIRGLNKVLNRKGATAYVRDSTKMYLILAYLKGKQPAKAREAMAQIEDPSVFNVFPYEILQEVTRLKRSESYAVATNILNNLLKTMIRPSHQTPVWMAKAEVLWLQNRRREARNIYKSVLSIPRAQLSFDSDNGEALDLEPLGMVKETDIDRMRDLQLSLRNKIVQQEGVDDILAMSAYRVGLSLMGEGDLKASKDYFLKAKDLAPTSTWAMAASSELDSIAFRNQYQDSIDEQLKRKPATKKRRRQ